MVGAIHCRPGEPLEPGERFDVGRTPTRRHGAKQGRRNQGRDEQGRARVLGRNPQEVVGENPADLITPQHAPSTFGRGIEHGQGTPVGVRVVGDDDVGADAPGRGERQVERAGLLGVGKRHRREVRVGCELFGHGHDLGEPRFAEDANEQNAAHTVHRGYDDLQRRSL